MQISVSLEGLPQFIQKSSLYRSFVENQQNENETFLIDCKFLKEDESVSSIQDFFKYIEVYKYWGLDNVSDSVFDFFANHPKAAKSIELDVIPEQERKLYKMFLLFASLRSPTPYIIYY